MDHLRGYSFWYFSLTRWLLQFVSTCYWISRVMSFTCYGFWIREFLFYKYFNIYGNILVFPQIISKTYLKIKIKCDVPSVTNHTCLPAIDQFLTREKRVWWFLILQIYRSRSIRYSVGFGSRQCQFLISK